MTIAEAALLVRAEQAQGRAVVMCHGCFDIVHPGHVRHLRQAAALGDRLLVTVTGDAMMNKGEGRPLIPQELRAENLAAIDCVDWVAIGDEATAVPLLETIRPDVYVKGCEYETSGDPRFAAERSAVEAYGGRVVFTSGDVVFSSSELIESMERTAHPQHAQLRRLLERHDLRPAALRRTMAGFAGRRVLVVGEAIVDTYVMCDQPAVAGEGPVLTLRPIEYRSFDGGAAIIARHLAAMGARPALLTPLPPGDAADALRRRLEQAGIEVHGMPVTRGLAEKRRFLVGTTKMMKLDLAEPLVLDTAQRERIVETGLDLARGADALVVADFGLGFFSAPSLAALCRRARAIVPVLAGDVSGRRAGLLSMEEMDVLCPSETEMREALGAWDDGLSQAVWRLLAHTRSRAAIVKLGADGLTAFGRALAEVPAARSAPGPLPAEYVPALAPHAVDPLGCGDALLAAVTLCLAAGGTLAQGALVGSVAAAVEAGILGNAVVGSAELRRGLERLAGLHLTCAAQPGFLSSSDDHVPLAHAQPA
jgi:rfaE bifunctional protein nucleotidyltransferase chain/domain